MDQDDHVEFITTAKELRVLQIGDIHTLCRRMNLQQSGTSFMTPNQFFDSVSPVWID